MRTEAIVFPRANEVEYAEVEIADPKPGDAVVRTLVTLVSTGTDTRTLRGSQHGGAFPLVPGYSAVGVVEEIKGEASVRPGDLVFSGGTQEILDANRCWGAQVCHCVKPAAELIPLSGRRGAPEYAFSKVAAIGLHGVRRTRTMPGDPVVVIGQGLIGLLHGRIQSAMGRKLLAVDIIPWRLQLAEAGGAVRTVDAREQDVRAVAKEMWPEGVPAAVEASARQEGIDLCVDLLKERAWNSDERMPMLVLQANYPERIELDPLAVFMKEYMLVNTRDTDRRDVEATAQMLDSGALEVQDLITLKRPAREATETFHELLEHPERHVTALFEWE